ncbi:nitronate monooxygenase [Coraliomargarita parva]|uniref:nitronate monooxygenase n=1 Tax=Coraliomargarita parva TaxID=3014050 RepID=UPI0022B562CB|nr:nitronate monooxygenase [Coraliomargarita parva]
MIIQGGMGVAVSNWRLARAVSTCGELGVVSGTALDSVLIRRLQDGDPDGHMRRALAAFPYPKMVKPIVDRWFIPGGKAADAPYKMKPLPVVDMGIAEVELCIVANFVEIYLAKEGHNGFVGINLLEKIQVPTLASIFGAMLAGVDAVLMGGGIPIGIPAVLDALARLEPAELKMSVAGFPCGEAPRMCLDPMAHLPQDAKPLSRPKFLAIISSEVLAKTLVKKASGYVDGFVVEHYSAGGHNAPPRSKDGYGERDICNISKIAELGRPFWLAGGYASPDKLLDALALGAQGIQVGTAFACTEESGMLPEIKAEVIELYRSGNLDVITDYQASPTGYPFKRVDLACNDGEEPRYPCDLGYLRQLYRTESGEVGYRCPVAPAHVYEKKGGSAEETVGKRCLCNGLMASIGLAQVKDGAPVQPLVTWGEDMSFLDAFASEAPIRVSDLVVYLRSKLPASMRTVA